MYFTPFYFPFSIIITIMNIFFFFFFTSFIPSSP